MKRTRTLPPVTLPIERVAAELGGCFEWFDLCEAPRPQSARVWRRRDGGYTVRATGRSPDGKRVSYTVKVRTTGG